MIFPIYVVLVPNAERPYVSSSPPSPEIRQIPGLQVWRVEADLGGFEIVDGKVKVLADPYVAPL